MLTGPGSRLSQLKHQRSRNKENVPDRPQPATNHNLLKKLLRQIKQAQTEVDLPNLCLAPWALVFEST